MAVIKEQFIVIKVSALVKEDDGSSIVPAEIVKTFEAVATELLGDRVIVEVTSE